MKRKIGKRLLGIMMGLILALTSVISVNATDSVVYEETVDRIVKKLVSNNPELITHENRVHEGVGMLYTAGLDCEMIKDIEVVNDKIVYTFEYPNKITDKVSISKVNDGILLNITEENIYNELKICDDGNMYLNGEKIQIEVNESSEEVANKSLLMSSDNNNEIRGGEVTNWLTPTCPYGKKADYTYKLGTAKVADITLTASIENLALSAFVSLICKKLGVSTVKSDALSSVFSYIKTRNPTTKGLSYIVTNYAHKDYHNTYIKPIGRYAYKSNYKWYPEKNYKGTAYSQTLFFMKQIG